MIPSTEDIQLVLFFFDYVGRANTIVWDELVPMEINIKEDEVVSPFVFMDVACRLILELAGGGE